MGGAECPPLSDDAISAIPETCRLQATRRKPFCGVGDGSAWDSETTLVSSDTHGEADGRLGTQRPIERPVYTCDRNVFGLPKTKFPSRKVALVILSSAIWCLVTMPALMFWGLSPCSWSITSYMYSARCDLWSSNYLRYRVLEDKYPLNISAPCCSWHTVMAGSHDVGYLHVFQYADTVALSEALRDVQKGVIEGNKTNPLEPSWAPGLKALAAAVQFSDLRFSTEFLVGYT